MVDVTTPLYPRSWIVTGGRITKTDLRGQQFSDAVASDPQAVGVIEMARSHAFRLGNATELGLDELAIEDLGSDSERGRLDLVGSLVVILTRSVQLDPASGDVLKRPLGLLLGPKLFAVIEDDGEFGALTDLLRTNCDRLATEGPAGLLHAVLDHVVDGFTAVLTELENKADTLAEALFGDQPLDRAQQLEAFRLRRSLTVLRRVVEPMRDVTSKLTRAAGVEGHDLLDQLIPGRLQRDFADVDDHVAHAADILDGQRDVLSSLYETSLSLADVRLNMVMKKLSAWAAIIAVPTLITGFMGMNVPYPGFGKPIGVIVAVTVMVVAVLSLYLTFKRKDWL
jgi:magnesium transporter